MNQKIRDEYYLLTSKLEEIQWALDGECNDIDCDEYMYKDLLKKRYKPILNHNFSCLTNLKKEKEAAMRLLSMKKFRQLRHNKCKVCKKIVDTLSDNSTIVSFTRPSKRNKNYIEWKGHWVHKKCEKRLIPPKGWKPL